MGKFKAGDIVRVVAGSIGWSNKRLGVNLVVVDGPHITRYFDECKITVKNANYYAHELELVQSASNTLPKFQLCDIVKLKDSAQGWVREMYGRLLYVVEHVKQVHHAENFTCVTLTTLERFPNDFYIVQEGSPRVPKENPELVKLQKQIDELQAQAKKLEESMKP